MSSEFAGRTVLVVGGRKGIGRAVAEKLASENASVHVFDVLGMQPEEPTGVQQWHTVDASDPDDLFDAASSLVQETGGVDHLVYCAAVFPHGRFEALDRAAFHSALAVNLFGAVECFRAVVPAMVERRFGRIVLFGSVLARKGGVGSSAYSTSKGGLLGLARTAALEYATDGLRINVLSPGITDTDQPRGHLTEEQLAAAGTQNPSGRIATVDDVVNACVFLLDDRSSFVTGQELRVTGGVDLW